MSFAYKVRVSIYVIIALLGIGGFFGIVFLLNPQTAKWYYFAGLYLAVFIGVFGFSAMLGIILRYSFGSKVALFKSQKVVIRQSFLLAILVSVALAFQSQRVLNPYTGLLLLLSLGIIELYFLNR